MPRGGNGIGEVTQGTGRQDEGLRDRAPCSAAEPGREDNRKQLIFRAPLPSQASRRSAKHDSGEKYSVLPARV